MKNLSTNNHIIETAITYAQANPMECFLIATAAMALILYGIAFKDSWPR